MPLAIEAPMRQINSAHSAESLIVLVSLHAVAREAARAAGVAKCDLPDCKTWRKAFLGRSDLSTADAKAAAIQRCKILGWPVEDHNVAEACGLWFHAMALKYPRWRPGAA